MALKINYNRYTHLFLQRKLVVNVHNVQCIEKPMEQTFWRDNMRQEEQIVYGKSGSESFSEKYLIFYKKRNPSFRSQL